MEGGSVVKLYFHISLEPETSFIHTRSNTIESEEGLHIALKAVGVYYTLESLQSIMPLLDV